GEGYSSSYYSYMWAEVMDADAFACFTEAGNVFDPGVAQRLKDHILSAGNKQDPVDAYLAFRGRMPKIDALMKKRGLAA
ncbi:MAG: M3 family metallopeptidase, partial [Stappiaceae bacterium]